MADLVYLVRHAAPPREKQGRYWGRTDPGIDAESLAGAADLVRFLWSGPRVLLASPLARTMATAQTLGRKLGLAPETADDLAEVDFGSFEGANFTEVEKKHPEAAREWAEKGDAFAFPGGESIQDFLTRAERAFVACTKRPEETVMCVTHAGIIAAWCCLFLRMPSWHRFTFRPEYAALTAFVRKKDGSGWEMAFFNNRD